MNDKKGNILLLSRIELQQKLPHRNTVDFIACVILYGFPLNPISCNI